MLDALLANQLVKAIAPGTHLLLVGDPDQLPSVGAGDVLADLLRVRAVPGHAPDAHLPPGRRLGHRRQRPAHQRRRSCRASAGEIADCFFLPAEDPAEAAQLVVDLVAQRLAGALRLRAGRGAGALADAPRGGRGRCAQHAACRSGSTPAREGVPEARGGGRVYRPGDRVLQLKNDYDLEVFNGDLGTVRAIDPIEQELLRRPRRWAGGALPVRQPAPADPRLRHQRPQGAGGGVPGGGHPAADQPRGDAGADAALHRA